MASILDCAQNQLHLARLLNNCNQSYSTGGFFSFADLCDLRVSAFWFLIRLRFRRAA